VIPLRTSFIFWIIRKALRYPLLSFTVVVINFLIPRAMPGDPLIFVFGEEVYAIALSNPDLTNSLRSKYGLDLPIIDQFWIYLRNLISGDLGYSFSYGRPIADIIRERLPLTLIMTVPPMILSLVIGTILGTNLSWKPGSLKRIITALCMIVRSVPTYWSGMLLLLIFSLWAKWTPIGGAPPAGAPLSEFISHLALPALVLTMYNLSYVTIIVRGLTVEISGEPFITTGLSKGLNWFKFSSRYLIRPSLPPLVSLAAMEVGFAFSGALLVEIVFSWPGMGYTMWQAVTERDYPLLQATFTITALIVIFANALADILSYALDPRAR
jgi:peptide/nickel transport system permease protein